MYSKIQKITVACLLCCTIVAALTSCQDKDIECQSMKLTTPPAEQITGNLVGDDYVWTWPQTEDLKMQVTLYRNGTIAGTETIDGNTYTHHNVETNLDYSYVFKLTDGTNLSTGVVKNYRRPGAATPTGLAMSQAEKQGGYDALVQWNRVEGATNMKITATNGTRNITETLAGDATSFIIPDVQTGETWNVILVAVNNEGTSLKTTTSLLIGKTAIGFLSAYATPEQLISDGDDDEASAWLWLHETYPSAQYLYFGNITSAADLEPFRVLFWLRDLENVGEDAVWNMPEVVNAATPAITQWYKDGGSLLLWSHATAYVVKLGRLPEDMLRNNDRTIGTGAGGFNPDTWRMAVQLHPGSRFKKDASSHPIFRGLDYIETDRTKLIAFKGPGFTEDHNCLFFNIPWVLTGIGNQEEACYEHVTNEFGIYPLGTWDSQIDWVSQLNVWEAQQGNTEFKGTLLCIGNGGCEFSMKNPDGTPDKSAHPKNNIYQDNVLTLAKNSLEYLKTR